MGRFDQLSEEERDLLLQMLGQHIRESQADVDAGDDDEYLPIAKALFDEIPSPSNTKEHY